MKLLVSDTTRVFRPQAGEVRLPAPEDWFDVLEKVASQLGTESMERLTPGALLRAGRDAAIVAWNPSLLTIVARLLGHRVVYLCWGLPPKSGKLAYALKLARLRGILASSSAVLVNDPLTAEDVAHMCGRSASIVPYVVDGAFFRPATDTPRSDFLLVPGSNDRDEDLVTDIALATKRRVIRVTQSQAVAERHASSPVEVHFNISYERLAALYQQAACVLLPIHSNNHTAGQTAVLEAVASGAPVIMSEGRTGKLVQEFTSVIIAPSRGLTDWLEAIRMADRIRHDEQAMLLRNAERVRMAHAPRVVAAALVQAIVAQPSP